MKNLILVLAMGFLSNLMYGADQMNLDGDPVKSIYDITITSIDGNEINLSEYKGQKILFVNVASKCGYTGQYKELQELHEKYGEQVVLIGLPCNQFARQEPGSHEEIKAFCEKNYGVTFLITEKIDVKGDDQHELYEWLTQKSLNGALDSKVKWNFQKYLVDESGNLKAMFNPGTNPMSSEITDYLK